MKLKKSPALLLSLALLFAAAFIHAAEKGALSEAELISKLDARLHFQDGEVTLPGGVAKLNLPPAFRYLDPKDSEFVLVNVWGNPPGPKTLGMIFPKGVSPASCNGWAVVITYSDDGYVKDSDADSINYTKLLKQMQKATAEGNKERAQQGFGTVELVGWAAPPRYDKETHKMYWAKELRFSDSPINTLNYNIRVLGRSGVLNLNVVASMDALTTIETSAPEIVALANFTDGNRYADFNQSTDKIATYGLAALVAGGIAAKAGLFKGLLAALLAGKKFVIIGLIALGAVLKKIFSGRKQV